MEGTDRWLDLASLSVIPTLPKPGTPVVLTVLLHHELGPSLFRNLIRKTVACPSICLAASSP